MDYQTIQPIVTAAGLGLAWAYYKYRSDILDPTKESPDKFEPVKACYTVLLAVIISICYTLAGKELDITGLDAYVGIAAGLTAPYIQPGINAFIRRYKAEMEAINEEEFLGD